MTALLTNLVSRMLATARPQSQSRDGARLGLPPPHLVQLHPILEARQGDVPAVREEDFLADSELAHRACGRDLARPSAWNDQTRTITANRPKDLHLPWGNFADALTSVSDELRPGD